jgi:hypothetical protein
MPILTLTSSVADFQGIAIHFLAGLSRVRFRWRGNLSNLSLSLLIEKRKDEARSEKIS